MYVNDFLFCLVISSASAQKASLEAGFSHMIRYEADLDFSYNISVHVCNLN